MVEIGTLLQDRYLIEKQIGAGGMGAVYRAVDQRFDNHVAIKETFYSDEEFGGAFEREARLLNGLQHPVLPHVTDFFTENSGHFLVMQYIEGDDLSAILKREGAFPVEDVLRWTDNLLDALDYLHSQEPPVIHRDIKPQNLKLTPRGGIILLDFGLAKLKSEDTTGVKSVFGYSRRYSPLEQIQGTGTDARSDIFSLGATVFHLLTGKQPVEVLARATQIIAGKTDPLQLASEINDQVPVKVAAVLHSAMALNPDQRFVSADAMRKALLDASSNRDETADELFEKAAVVTAASSNQIASPVETENFPALEAFVDEIKHSAQTEPETIEIPIQNTETDFPAADEDLPQRAAVIDTPIVADVNYNRPPYRTAALAALLIFAVVAVGYIIFQAGSSETHADAPVVQASPELKLENEQAEAESDPPPFEIPASAYVTEEDQAEIQTQPAEKIAEKPITLEKNEVSEVPAEVAISREKPKPAPIENSRPVTAHNMPRKKAETDGETRARVVKEPVPDIEVIFTGRPSWEDDRRQQRREERRQQREQMSEEEWREHRRQRREQRRKRQNGKPFPF